MKLSVCFFQRIYWAIVIIASLAGMALILTYTMDAYDNDAITVNMDTSYLRWNNTFPAVSFCILRPFNYYAETRVRDFASQYYADNNIEDPFGYILF